ncbi:unnamed protein product [Camellia sinensis]
MGSYYSHSGIIAFTTSSKQRQTDPHSMLLRSSSTPLVQSPFSDTPTTAATTRLSSVHGGHHHHHHHHHPHHLCLTSFSCNSSPISPSSSGSSDFNRKTNKLTHKAFRRARSDGNLEGLASTSFDLGKLCNSNKSSMLRAPSFSIYASNDGSDEENGEKEGLERIEVLGSGEFSFRKKGMGLIEENDGEEEDEEVLNEFQDLGIGEVIEPASPPMYLATGLGIGGASAGAGTGTGGGGGNVEEYYKRMVGEDPSNPLFLRNYAQLLQSKGDLHGAKEYYFQATLADPKDGEILLLYAKLVWKLHQDQDTAWNYFERAAQAAPEDSHVLAAYACFLWEIEENKEDCSVNDHTQIEEDKAPVEVQKTPFEEEKEPVSPSLHLAIGVGIAVAVFGGIDGVDCIAADFGKGGNMEDYYKRMVEENPSNPLFLRNYAQFLYQSKRDLQGAEQYYSRAVLADPADGEIISQYAKLVWELHHDQDKAMSYFERAVQATPEHSHVLAAYANFLWQTEEDEEEDGAAQDHIQAPLLLGAMTAANV